MSRSDPIPHMKRPITLHRTEEVDGYMETLRSSAGEAHIKLAEIAGYESPLELLYKIKFEQIGFDPLDTERPLNLIEQVNQTFTYLASFKAARLLFLWHPGIKSLVMNLGTQSGSDIESDYDGGISAEVFAAVTTTSNDKLKKDLDRLSSSSARHRYFFSSPQAVLKANTRNAKPQPA
jgi:hypothetical protein